jgi:hypothetical protein
MSFDLVAHLYRQRAFSRATFGPGRRVAGVSDHIRRELAEFAKASEAAEAAQEAESEALATTLGPIPGSIAKEAKDTRDALAAEAADVILLSLDLAWRAGLEPERIARAVKEKQDRNELRDWPDWRTQPADKAIEHTREGV